MNNPQSIADLKKSPMFNLSLSSKELFHSNLLAWIAEDRDTEDLFVSILIDFGLEDCRAKELAEGIRQGKYEVKREFQNFDFCICENFEYRESRSDNTKVKKIQGQIVLVLENKFKSIPYEKQLREYQEKVIKDNKAAAKNLAKLDYINQKHISEKPQKWSKKEVEGIQPTPCHFVLLSLSENTLGLKTDSGDSTVHIHGEGGQQKWKMVSYREYAKLIADKVKLRNNYKEIVLFDYANYLNIFCKYIQETLPNDVTVEKWNDIMSSRPELKNIRMDDIWQKLIVNSIAIELRNRIETTWNCECVFGNDAESFIADPSSKNKVHLATGFSRGAGLIEVKIKITDDCLFGIQIQNEYYKRLLETTHNNKKKQTFISIIKEIDGMFSTSGKKWKNPEGLDIFNPDDQIHPIRRRGDKILEGFGGYGDTFICQSKKLSSICLVKDVIDAIIKDINTLFPHGTKTRIGRETHE